MGKWYCSLSESYHDSEEEAQEVCREFIDDYDYIEHIYDIEHSRLFEALTNSQIAEIVLDEIIQATEKDFFENYVTKAEDEEDEEED